MRTSSHLDKFERLRALRARLDPIEDFELWLWATVTAGANALDASLCLAGVARAAQVEPGPVDASAPTAAAEDPSLDAVRRTPLEAMPEDIRRLAQALDVVGSHSGPCVHAGRAPTRAIVDECESAFFQVCAVLRRRCDWSLL